MRPPFAALLAAVLLVASCAAQESGGTERRRDPTTTVGAAPETTADATTTTSPAPEGEVVGVEAVLDGDSLAVYRNGQRVEVRLAGINTPEADECFGDAARTVLSELTGNEVILVGVAEEDDRDQFGRLLRNVYVGGTWLNLTMVETGAALALQSGTPDEAALVAAEDGAWQGGAGLWGSSVCGAFPEGMRIGDIRYDPPGRDFENKEEEFVLLANEGGESIDLSGWILRDESSTHRYVFADGVVVAPGEGLRIRTGCGNDAGRDLYWCADDAVWSNGGDTVILQTASGTVVDRWKYAGDF